MSKELIEHSLETIKNITSSREQGINIKLKDDDVYKKELRIIEKCLKALEIIRRTNLDLDYVRINPNFHQYRVRLKNSFMDLEITEEEFKLLKELL